VLPNFLLLKLQALHLSSLKLLKPKHSTCWWWNDYKRNVGKVSW
jgi:hypothetical protein